MNKRKAVFLDRDGTLNVEVAIVARPEDLLPLEGIGAAVRGLNDAGFLAILTTNQAIIARGDCEPAMLRRIHAGLRATLAEAGARLDGIYFCPHHPDYGPPCLCRKPKPGLVLAAAADFEIDLAKSWVVGDSAKDIQMARNAGVRCILVCTGKGGSDRGTEGMHAEPDFIFDSLREAAAFIASAP